MEKLNTIFFTLMTHGPDGMSILSRAADILCQANISDVSLMYSYSLRCAADISDVSGKEQAEQQQSKKGRGRRQ